MASTYKTPGVYVEEITKFPPSVASVETAIPAFIGYTEKAEKNGESLKNIPTRIESFLEFEQYFGGPPSRAVIVRLNTTNQYLRTERKGTPYLLYDSMRLFYDNGGGVCYIVSVDNYKQPPAIGDDTKGILGGLKALEKYDEPTLILSPDATTLDADLYTFQQQAIAQCNKLQDRFLICDLLNNDEKTASQTFDDRVAAFRDNIGINYLKYGAAYTPWLRTSLSAGLRFRDIIFALDGEIAPNEATSLALLTSLTNVPSLLQLIFDLSNAIKAVDLINSKLKPGAPGGLVDSAFTDIDSQLRKLLKDYLAVYNDPTKTAFTDFTATLQAIYSKIRDILQMIKVIYDSLPTVVAALPTPSSTQSVEFKLKNDIDKNKDVFKAIVMALATHHFELGQKSGALPNLLVADPKLTDILNFAGFASLAAVPKDAAVQNLYRTLTVKLAMLDEIHTIAGTLPAGPATAAAATLTADLPAAGTLKANIDAQLAASVIAVGAGGDTSDISLDLAGKLPGASDADKILIRILQTYVDEDIALNGIVTVSNFLPGGFPVSIVNTLNQSLLTTRQIINGVAANPAATNVDLTTALVVNVILSKEYTLIASSAASAQGLQAISLYNNILNAAASYESTFDQSLFQNFSLYKTFITKAGQDLMILPPGAAVAGVYASVDSNRGVWKAPANASLASVLGPYFLISSQEQEGLNIDTNGGKSINAIRFFTGRGTLVWGTRTLAGNDNEWRYVPVRRFFNYAEESLKKATEPFVFEPNDINTWVRVKAMCENFLTLEWRRGALAGAKPSDAFFVKVGLGETMTALDILEGRMIIEIGMAVVRPAEFIILRFSHKMQES
ncbi:MAG TPA: phage tail sheath C-terminal domain-containing protein [Chitinophagaceae bacterium]|jgi:phage tail sheath protein FI|nr:phage tail sheath C-terminal domain-containing protein [Chitinophagaceae bacterium]